MKAVVAILVGCVLLLGGANVASASLDDFMKRVNVDAQIDLGNFKARVSSQYGVTSAHVEAVLGKVKEPADVYMVFELGRMSGKPADRVIEVYEKGGKKKGWGAMAQELGIKPGSRDFKALKAGDLVFSGEPSPGGKEKKEKGQGKGKKK